MTQLISLPQTTLAKGQFTSSALTLAQGTKELSVNYTMPGWPAVADGQITVTLLISDDGGANFRTEWSDVFQHVVLKRGGVAQASANFGIKLQNPFGATSKMKVGFENTVAAGITTALTVDAT